MDMGGMLGWASPHGDVFRRLLCHRNIAPYLIDLCGEGYRLDHHPLVIVQDKDSEGFALHGGPISGTIRRIPKNINNLRIYHFEMLAMNL